MKIGLILTNDWELFGDGTGDFFDLQFHPLINLMELLDKYNANITIMAETGQQLAFLKSTNEQHQLCATSWESVLKKVIASGSDVQLHYHPQWYNVKFTQDKWNLNLGNWKLSSLDSHAMVIKLKEAKDYLEKVIKEEKHDYKCRVFRAGSYCIQPAGEPINALKKIGILADSSVTKDYKNDGFFDYTNAASNLIPYRTSKEFIEKKGEDGLIEFPIYSENIYHSEAIKKYSKESYYSWFHKINVPHDEILWQLEKEKTKDEKYPRSQRYYKKNEGKSLKWYFSKIIQKSAIQLDYDNLPATIFVNMLKNIIKSNKDDDRIIPVVASGHLKDIHNLKNIEKILNLIKTEIEEDIIYWTFDTALNYWEKKV
jgi:hypothetical protein